MLPLFSVESALLQCLLKYHKEGAGLTVSDQEAVKSRQRCRIWLEVSDSTGAVKCKDVCVLNLFTVTSFCHCSLSQPSKVSESITLSMYYMELFIIARKWIRRAFSQHSSGVLHVQEQFSLLNGALKGWAKLQISETSPSSSSRPQSELIADDHSLSYNAMQFKSWFDTVRMLNSA